MRMLRLLIRTLDVASSVSASLARGGTRLHVELPGARPERMLELYEFENCPFCRKVREALSILDLEARIFPCPKGGTRFRPDLLKRGGKLQVPYLVDPNTGQEMYESSNIVEYLFRTYGSGPAPWWLAVGPLADATCSLASAYRLWRGTYARPSRFPEFPLELWSYESSPYCRIVREALSTLEMPYLVRNVAKGSPRRAEFVERSGEMTVPYLADPNTGIEMFESADIVRYVVNTYGLEEEPTEAAAV